MVGIESPYPTSNKYVESDGRFDRTLRIPPISAGETVIINIVRREINN
jgi:hypothetical protein